MPSFTDDELDREVLFQLKMHVGHKNAVDRWELVAKIFGPGADLPRSDDNVSDRQIREAVRRLRRQGVIICDMGDGRGRFLAETSDEYQAFRQYFGAGAFEKIETMHEMDKAAQQLWPNALQPRLL
jgi:DNA-binding FadR family transcriptional regulator